MAELRLIVAIVETGSLTRAAARLGVRLSVVSRGLLQLEATAGVRLVDRTTRRLSVTGPGERLYRHALSALDHVDRAVVDLQLERDEPRGIVRVVMPSPAVTPALLARLAELRTTWPRLEVRLAVTRRELPLGADVDLAVVVGDVPDRAGLVARRAASLAWALCAAPAYLRARPAPAAPADLIHHDCLRFCGDEPQTTWTLEDGAGARVTVPVRGGLESDDSRVLGDATYAGLGIGIRPQRELAAAVEAGALVHLLPGWRFAGVPVSVVATHARDRLPGVRTVADMLLAALAELA